MGDKWGWEMTDWWVGQTSYALRGSYVGHGDAFIEFQWYSRSTTHAQSIIIYPFKFLLGVLANHHFVKQIHHIINFLELLFSSISPRIEWPMHRFYNPNLFWNWLYLCIFSNG